MNCLLHHVIVKSVTQTTGKFPFINRRLSVLFQKRHFFTTMSTSKDRWIPTKSPAPSFTSACHSQQDTLIAVAQMTATNDKETNFNTCKDLIEAAANRGAKIIFLPEGCDYIAETKLQSVEFAESMDGPTVTKYKDLANSNKIWLSLGGIHIRGENESKLNNTHLIINDSGDIVAKYNKAHLFNVCLPERNVDLRESSYVNAGDKVHLPVPTVAGMLGLGICYDMRFPEFSLIQRRLGAEILTFPSAFTVTTGLAHWEPLLRARAIENQCYVVAAAQTGQHNTRRSSYGHAMIIDPWGAIVAQMSERTGIAVAEIDHSYTNKIRSEMPVINHKRDDLYHTQLNTPPHKPHLMELLSQPSEYSYYVFGSVMVPGNCIFLKSKLSNAFVNKKTVVPGHCLVTTEKLNRRLSDATEAEISDLAQMVQFADEVIRTEYDVDSSQIAIQDGQHAGQTIEHVHVHILPWGEERSRLSRKESALSLQKHEKSNSKIRSVEAMIEEATRLNKLARQLGCDLFDEYSMDTPKSIELDKMITGQNFNFLKHKILSREIILISELCFAFNAQNPILPGHIYVTFKESKPSFKNLTPREVSEFFLIIKEAQQITENAQETTSSTIAIFNGKSAGQHIEQVHAHIIPRTADDLDNNDDIYHQIQNHNFILSLPNTPKEQSTNSQENEADSLSECKIKCC